MEFESTELFSSARLIKYGKTYSLGITIDSNTPAYPPRSLSLQVVQPTQQFGVLGLPNSTYNDDVFQGVSGHRACRYQRASGSATP